MASSTAFHLKQTSHGKASVRVAKVRREPNGRQTLLELNVTVILECDDNDSFLHGDNSLVVSTDTCRNHVYLHAKETSFDSAEAFALGLAHRLLQLYHHINVVRITVEEANWCRFGCHDGAHAHGFIKEAGTRGCTLNADRTAMRLSSSLSDLSVAKTTQSGWSNFLRDEYTTIGETDERILATSLSATWRHGGDSLHALQGVDFDKTHTQVRETLLTAFFGPLETGTFSRGVQHTLYQMAVAVLSAVDDVTRVVLRLPNLHFLPCNLGVFTKNKLRFEDDVYIPTTEPAGVIEATVSRTS